MLKQKWNRSVLVSHSGIRTGNCDKQMLLKMKVGGVEVVVDNSKVARPRKSKSLWEAKTAHGESGKSRAVRDGRITRAV